MATPYEVTLIPLGFHAVNPKKETWRVFAICLPDLGTSDQAGLDVSSVVNDHPLFGTESVRLVFEPEGGDELDLDIQIENAGDLNLLKSILESANEPRNRSALAERRRPVVTRAQPTNSENFVDVSGVYDQQCRQYVSGLFTSIATEFNARPIEDLPTWDSYRALLARLDSAAFADKRRNINPDDPKERAIQRYKDMLKHRREYPCIKEEEFSVSQRELVLAVLQCPELALKTGLIVDLRATLKEQLPNSSVRGKLRLYLAGSVCTATHMSRHPINQQYFVVEPASRLETGNVTTLLTRVDGKQGDLPAAASAPYGVRSFSTDHMIVRSVVAPNSSSGSDEAGGKPSKYPNRHASKGLHPFVGGSITIDGPVRDLVNLSAQRPLFGDCKKDSPVHCLETLWDGYRLDVATVADSGEAEFESIHRQSRTFTPKGGTPISIGATEDCIYRIQTFSNDPTVQPVVHPALFSWDGRATFEILPWARERAADPKELWSVDYVKNKHGVPQKLLPRLEYKKNYAFRLRKVFQGGLSLSLADANTLTRALSNEDARPFLLTHQHARTRPFSPGVLHFPKQTAGPADPKLGKDVVLRVGRHQPMIEFWLYPQPIDREETRFHGLLRQAFEKQRSDMACVEGNLSNFLLSRTQNPERPIGYFADPDVSQVMVRAWTLGNQWLTPTPNPIVDRKLSGSLTVIRSTDVDPVRIKSTGAVSFGNEPFAYRPIRIRIRTTTSRHAGLEVSNQGRFGTIELKIPRGDRIKMEILPDASESVFEKHTAWQEYGFAARSVRAEGLANDLRYLMPTLTVPLTLEAVHTTAKPQRPPTFERLLLQDGDDHDADLVQVFRKDKEQAMSLSAAVQVDPRTTGVVTLEAQWRNYVDDVALPMPVVVGQRSMRTDERSVYFGPAVHLDEEVDDAYGVLSSTALSSRRLSSVELYSTERTILFGAAAIPSKDAPQTSDSANCGATIEMGDLRHYRVSVAAVARGRYAADYPDEEASKRSTPRVVDLPSSLLMPAPVVSHVIALSSSPALQDIDGRWVSHRHQKMRIYLHRPWCISGEGELLAVVFDRDWRAHNSRDAIEVPSPATAWGEDPLYRTYEAQTIDNISPQAVANMFAAYCRDSAVDDGYPCLVQGELSGDKFNLISGPDQTSDEKQEDYRDAHIVGVRPTFDAHQKLWYVELQPGDRHRWIRFKLARFQPIAKPGFHMSSTAVFVNFLSTRDITVTVIKHIDVVEVMLDTVPYSGQAFGHETLRPEKRFSLFFSDQIAHDVYDDGLECKKGCHDGDQTHPARQLVLPETNVRSDEGNVRYVWKLGITQWQVAMIKDEFRQFVVARVERRML